MRIALLVLVLVTVPLAGCSGLPAGDTPSSPTADSSTTLPDGLSENGTIDTETLVNGHVETLREENYTVQKQIDVETENGTTLVKYTHVSKVGNNRTQVVDRQTYDNKRVDWWINGTRTVSRTQESNSTEYSVNNNSVGGTPGLLGGDALRQALDNAEDPTITTEDGIVQIRSTTTPDDLVRGYEIVGGVNMTNQTTTVTMTEDGRITRYTTEFTGHPADDPETTITGTYDLHYTAYGGTTVERPSWVEDARNASTERDQ